MNQILTAFGKLTVFLIVISSCTHKFEGKLPVSSTQETDIGVSKQQNGDFYDFFYTDSINLADLTKWDAADILIDSSNDFGESNGKAYLRSPYEINKTNFLLQLINSRSQEKKSITVKVRSWDIGSYSAKYYDSLPQQKFFVHTEGNISYFFQNGKLYKSLDGINKEYLSDFPLDDYMYNEMVVKDNYYAVRTGMYLYISRDLKNWKLIYSGTRGVKQSMIFVDNIKGRELLFSEYHPGTNYIRHHVRAYNFYNDSIEVRKLFYSRTDYDAAKLLPTARHIHFLVKDPYSNLIFLGNGDLDRECAIYFSDDNGITFKYLGGGKQIWRSLCMMFTPTAILWSSDTQTPQYILRLNRQDIRENADAAKVIKYPLLGGALWCALKMNDSSYLLSANGEGALYDTKYRNFFVTIKNDIPSIYEVYENQGKGQWAIYSQRYPEGMDMNGYVYLLDTETYKTYKIKVVKKQ